MANGAPPSTRRSFLAGAAGALAASALAAGCRKHRDAITLGLYAALTGSMADFGTASRNGVTLAAEEINAAGGLLGKRLYIAIEDTRGDSAEAASAVTRLIHIEGAVGILGEVASSLSLAGGRICQRYRVPMVPTPTAVSRLLEPSSGSNNTQYLPPSWPRRRMVGCSSSSLPSTAIDPRPPRTRMITSLAITSICN
jgi:ABC-type branched-subunit amino acid transport system substrate-binding protein